jgi:hypothetical protein
MKGKGLCQPSLRRQALQAIPGHSHPQTYSGPSRSQLALWKQIPELVKINEDLEVGFEI